MKVFTMQNVTFYNRPMLWKDAAFFCLSKDGVLESNGTYLTEQYSYILNELDNVWLGKYVLLTNWTYIRGCFMINEDLIHFVIKLPDPTELQCQMLCNKYTFYSLKGEDCYCIDDIDPFNSSNNCDCVGCYKVWKHRFHTNDAVGQKFKCIAIECIDGVLTRSYKQCNTAYDVTCDNNEELGYDYENHQLSANECKRRASFIKWYPENSCDTHQLQHQYWTSGRRHIVKFRLWKSYMPENVKLMKCLILNKDNGEKRKSCKNDVFPFFCRFGSAKEIILSPTVTIPPQQKIAQSDKSESIAARTVTSCIVVIAVIVVLIFLRRRRLSNEKQTRHASTSFENVKGTVKEQICNTTSQSAVYHEIEVQNFRPQTLMLNSQTVNNIPYNQVNSDRTPKSQNVNQSAKNTIQTKLNSVDFQRKVSQNEYEMSKVINENGNSSEGVSSSNYCLAKPITSSTEDDLDPYDINKDYDHLNIVKKKEDLITKVYDHLPTAVTDDPTYDHSNLNSTLDNEDYYDHFKNDGDND